MSEMVKHSEMSSNNVKGTDYTTVEKKQTQQTRYLLVGIGQCGGSLAVETKKKLGPSAKVVAINSSYHDLDTLPTDQVPQEFKIKYGTMDGTGKNREISKNMFLSHRVAGEGGKQLDIVDHFLYNYGEFLFSVKNHVTVLIMFSSAGGSGSGAGPFFTTKLNQTIKQMTSYKLRDKMIEINDVNRPDIVGICVTPDFDSEGVKSLQNTIECGSEIQKAVAAKLASFWITTNKVDGGENMTKIDRYEYVNGRISDAIIRFLGVFGKSKYKCIDTQDKRSAIQIPGIAAFFSFDENREPVGYQFMLPKRQRVRQLIAELPEKYSDSSSEYVSDKIVETVLAKLDITTDDQNIGYFGESSEHTLSDIIDRKLIFSPIIGLFGCTEIGTLFEPFKQRLEHLMRAGEEKSDLMNSSGHSFDQVKETKQQVRNEFACKTVNVSDIDSMFD